MSCPSELTYSMYVDGALQAEEVVGLMSHLKTCEQCQALLADLTEERRLLTDALQQTDEAIPVPEFRRSFSLRTLLGFFAGGGRAAVGNTHYLGRCIECFSSGEPAVAQSV